MDAKIADLKDRANKELMVEKRYAAAEALYTEALALNPSNVLLHSNRSLARYLQSNYSGALADAEQAVQLDPSWLKGHFHRVRALQALGGKQREARVAYSVGLDVAGGRDNARQESVFCVFLFFVCLFGLWGGFRSIVICHFRSKWSATTLPRTMRP